VIVITFPKNEKVRKRFIFALSRAGDGTRTRNLLITKQQDISIPKILPP